jgi:tetratricopeptide (TPR) repeat protein
MLIKKNIDYIYNYQFKDAEETCNKIGIIFPGHPVEFLLKGMITYWENYPLLTNSPSSVLFEGDLRKCIEICENKTDLIDDPEYLLTNLCARGMLLLYYTDNDKSLEVIPLALSTYHYIRRSFDFTSVYSDFYYFTGIYNYYRKVYPDEYPIYKPLAALIPKGDKERGIKELRKAAGSSIVLRAESLIFLSEIYRRFEGDCKQATYYNKVLYELYPANMEYSEEYIKNLLLIKQYDEAEKLISSIGVIKSNIFFKAQLTIFSGIIMEKKYHDFKQAQEFYLMGIKDITPFGNYSNEFVAYAYFGLSRISEVNGDKTMKKQYRKMANELADFKKITFDN